MFCESVYRNSEHGDNPFGQQLNYIEAWKNQSLGKNGPMIIMPRPNVSTEESHLRNNIDDEKILF
jgi:hypothetical protein